MARRIKLRRGGDFSRDQFNKLLREVVTEADAQLKKITPVDTGRLRAGWQVGQNKTDPSFPPPGRYPNVPEIKRLGYQQEKAGYIYSIHNSLPYAEPVLRGVNLPPSWNGQYFSKNNQYSPGELTIVTANIRAFTKQIENKYGRE